MKKLFLFILALSILSFAWSSETCLPQGVVFRTQTDVDNFQTDYPGCIEIEGDVIITESNITNLNGLSVLTAIRGDLIITNNDNLSDLTGLEGLGMIGGDLKISNNNDLSSLTGLEGISAIEGRMDITYNPDLVDFTGLDNLRDIAGAVEISHNYGLTSLSGLDAVTIIGGYFIIAGNSSLENLSGLGDLTTIRGYLEIFDNDALLSTAGLNALSTLRGDLGVADNPQLVNLDGLEFLTSIEGNLVVINNASLSSLSSLIGITTLQGGIKISHNPTLPSLYGLDRIDPNSITSLFIHNNNTLSYCEVQSVCDYLPGHNSTVYIHVNTSGCNSQMEVEKNCMFLHRDEMNAEEGISIFPNPANTSITINSKTIVDEVIIYNQTGQRVLQEAFEGLVVDISELNSGMYIIEIISGPYKTMKKLIVE